MKSKTRIFLAIACLWVLGRAFAAEGYRTDINPGLLYWQAFAVLPDLSPEEQKYLFESEWRTRPMDERAGQLALRYDSTFRFLRQAAAAKVECDWGVDLFEGPHALLPQLAKAKRCAQAATLRARWFVQQNRRKAAHDDLAAAFVLGRNLARDQVLISGLVQIAIESIISGHIVQQWPQLDTETIGSLLSGFDHAPARGTMAACMRTEKTAFYDWLVRKIEALQVEFAHDDRAALATASQLLTDMASEDSQNRTDFAVDVINAAGNSTAGLLKYVQQLEPFYTELEQVMKLPYREFQPAIDEFYQRISAHSNLILQEFFPAVLKVRMKEFRVTARLAMVRAAYQHRLNPATGLQSVEDPFGSGPFEYSRFMLDGVDRGFKLKSQLRVPDFDEILIFAEKASPAFYIDGPNAGQKVP